MRFHFQYRRYRLPFRMAVRTAHGSWAEREGVIVRLENEGQGVGLGEAAPIPWFGTESVDEIEAACRELGERVEEARLGEVPASLGCLQGAMTTALADAKQNPRDSAEAAVNENRNATGNPGPAYLAIAALLPAGRAALPQIEPKAESGFRVFKWKVGVADVADELSLLDDVCAALPSGAKLRLDANGAWDRRKTERWLERCADRPVEFLEQPIAADARGAQDVLRGLANDYPTPLALDESLVGEGDVERWIGAGWPGVFVVKPSLLANPQRALAQLARAKARVVFSSALETRVGARAALRLAFGWARSTSAVENRESFALGFGVWPLFQDARFDGPALAPFVRVEDVERLNVEETWTALS